MSKDKKFILGIVGVVWIVATTFTTNALVSDIGRLKERVATLEDQMFTVCITGGCEE
jgi:hypothetical protein